MNIPGATNNIMSFKVKLNPRQVSSQKLQHQLTPSITNEIIHIFVGQASALSGDSPISR